MYRPWVVILLIIVMSTFADGHRAQAQECLKIVAVEDALNRQLGERFEQQFARQNPCFTVSYLPAARASQSFLSGAYDGELARIADYPPFEGEDVVMVPVPLVAGMGILVARDPKVKTIKDLGHRELGLQRGVEWAITIAKRHINKILLPNADIMVDMFNKGRLDAFLIDNINLRYHASDLVDGHQSVVLERSGYLWLSGRHKLLIPSIVRGLEEFAVDGIDISALGNG
jgi:ABC-type amino acid transport substrate-binding protein